MRKIVTGLLLVFVLLLIACTGGKREERQKISLPFSVEIHSLDPRKITEHSHSQISNMLYEGLMSHDELGGLSLGLAESFSINKEQTEYTFILRDACWSNGMPITAYDVEYSWKGVLSHHLFSGNTTLMYFLKNAKKHMQGECKISEIGVKALNEKTLLVILENPTPFFLELLTVSIFKPVPNLIDERRKGWDTSFSQEILTSGPFRIKHYQRGMGLTLEKNPNYWDQEVVSLNEIELVHISDTQTQALLFKNKELDWYGQPIGAFDGDAYANIGQPEPVHHRPVYAVVWLQVNTENPILSNKNIRKALSYAINRQEIVNHVVKKRVVECNTFLPNTHGDEIEPLIVTEEDARQALEQGLTELGLTKNELPPIELTYVQLGANQKVAEVIQNQVRETLGIQISLMNREWKIFLDAVARGSFQLAEIAWFSSYPDPSYFLYMFQDKGAKNNYSRWENKRYTELTHMLTKEWRNEKRAIIIAELNQIATEEFPVIPLFTTTYSYAMNPRLTNVVISEMGIADFKYAKLVNEEKAN